MTRKTSKFINIKQLINLFRKNSNSSSNKTTKSKVYQPQIALNKNDEQEKTVIPSFNANNRNLIDFNLQKTTQNKSVEVKSLQKSDLISFNATNDIPTTSSKKQSEFNFINNRKVNSISEFNSNLNNNLIDVNADSTPVKLKSLNENISKLYSNIDQQESSKMDYSNRNYSSYNCVYQPNINIQNTYHQYYENQITNQGPVGHYNGQLNGYNQHNQNQNYNGYNGAFNNQNNHYSLNNSNHVDYSRNNNNYGNPNSQYQPNLNYIDYSFGLTPSINGANSHFNMTEDKNKNNNNKKDDPFKNLVSFK